MAEALEEIVGDRLTEGFVNVLRGTKSSFQTRKILLNEAGHPIPDEDGVEGARRIIQLVSKAKERAFLFASFQEGFCFDASPRDRYHPTR